MTEQEWLACSEPQPMLDFLRWRAKSDRKLRLFAVAACKRLGDLIANPLIVRAIEMAEQYADGLVDGAALRSVERLVRGPASQINTWAAFSDAHAAAYHVIQNVPRVASSGVKVAQRTETRILEQKAQAELMRDLFGNSVYRVIVDSAWLTSNVTGLAQAIYADRVFDRLPILADALEDTGCDNADILNHCRQPGEHVRGCWVIDLLLGKS